jgi:8-oxo-dGTP pyrophosphatase MutT (NUDIX family)
MTDKYLLKFDDFIGFVQNRLRSGLPGRHAHQRMISQSRKGEFPDYPGSGIKASVLFLLYPVDDNVFTVLIRRPVYEGVHSGQIALPGGKFNEEDGTLLQTALREANEEVGILPDRVNIIGPLTDLLIPPSKFLLTPFLAFSSSRPIFQADPEEVAEIIETDIRAISDKNLKEKDITVHGGRVFTTPYYDIQNHVVWGATAMILSEFAELIKG